MQRLNAVLLWRLVVGTKQQNAVRLGVASNIVLVSALVSAFIGCSPSKRKFDPVASEPATSEPATSETATSETASGDAAALSSVDGDTSFTEGVPVSSGDPSTSDLTSAASSSEEPQPCAPADAASCPADTECRKYHADGCDKAGKPACQYTDTQGETPCADGAGQCDGKGQCVVPNLARLGESCEENEQCGSGHCTAGQDGQKLCCDAACDGACTACSSDGHCDVTPTADAECGELTCPESNECTTYPPSRAACASFGECATTESYCEPEFTTASCGGGGTCNGSGSCCPKPGPERECTKECPCDTGGGVCTSDDQCLTGYVCTKDAKTKLGFPGSSCLPAHCVNDKQDEGESSVDCGGGCGCRATYEVVEITGVPEGAQFSELRAMSGDGSAFAGTIGRSRSSFPARVSAKGIVTELQGYGASGGATGINTDGTVVVGSLGCSNPPDCTSTEGRPFRWVNKGPPEVVAPFDGHGVAVSATGAIVAGNSSTTVFRARVNGNRTLISEMTSVVDMSADGEYIAGNSTDAGVLWSAAGLTSFEPPAHWSSWRIDAMSDSGKVLVGTGYESGNNAESFPFIWKDGTFTAFPRLPGAAYNIFGDLSADGSIAVGLSGTNSLQRAFIWDQTSGELRTVIAEAKNRGLELPVDLELTNGEFVTNDGRILVGRVFGAITPSFWRVTLLPDGEWLP